MAEDLTDKYKPVKLEYNSCSTTLNHNCEQPPIILMHGLFGNSSTWNKVKCQIGNKTGRKMYTIDLRNHGRSGYSDEFSLKHMVSDLLQFMKDENLSQIILVGHSLAGRIAMELALMKPQAVEMLVVEDATFSDQKELRLVFNGFAKTMNRMLTQLPPSMSVAEAQKMVQRILMNHLPQMSKNGDVSNFDKLFPFYKDKKTGEFKFPGNKDVLLQCLENIECLQNDLSNDLIYTGKTLFLKGELSLVDWDPDKELLIKHFPNSEFFLIPGANHLAHFEKSEEFIDKVSDFIRTNEKPYIQPPSTINIRTSST